MAVVLIKDRITAENLQIASEDYGGYIKITLDIKTGLMAIGGEWHADGEKILLENGSKQKDIWGGGIDIKSRMITTTALINLRPKQDNFSQDILDKQIRIKFVNIVRKKFEL